MSTDYDAWLQKPYQEAYEAQDRYEEAKVEYLAHFIYTEHLAEWLEENVGKTEADYQASKSFEDGACGFMEPERGEDE
jgi:hypothetical protein